MFNPFKLSVRKETPLLQTISPEEKYTDQGLKIIKM